jgi:hypothetical protein
LQNPTGIGNGTKNTNLRRYLSIERNRTDLLYFISNFYVQFKSTYLYTGQ